MRHLVTSRSVPFCGAVCISLLASLGCSSRESSAPDRTLRLLLWTRPGPFATGMVAALNESVPGIEVVTEATQGSFFTVSKVEKGEAELGASQADVVYLAYRRGTNLLDRPHTNLRGIAVLWVNSVYVVARDDAGLTTIADFRGKRIGMMPAGSSGELMSRLTLEAHGLKYADFKPLFHAPEDLGEQFTAGTIDAAVATGASFPASLMQLSAAGAIRLLPIAPQVARELREKYPFIKAMRLPADGLPRVAAGARPLGDYETVGADGVLICHKDLDEPLVHALTEAFFRHLPEMKNPIARTIDPDSAPATPIPLHAGAARYYREQEILR